MNKPLHRIKYGVTPCGMTPPQVTRGSAEQEGNRAHDVSNPILRNVSVRGTW